jgi:hypothetical protein
MIIGTVVEGPTDRLVLQTVITKLIPGEHRFLPLQPLPTLGETGAGWKGVRRWCRQTWQVDGSSLDLILATPTSMDLLVIHVDADVAGEADLQEDDNDPITDVDQPCPPAKATVDRLAQVISHWLDRNTLPPQVLLAIPAQDIENWTFAALFPTDPLCAQPDYECTKKGTNWPCYKLTLKRYGKLLQRSNGEIKKPVRRYEAKLEAIAEAWEMVCIICPQALRLTEGILSRTG